ncbi:hypothetical protein D3C85_1315710 [compost metagenome]
MSIFETNFILMSFGNILSTLTPREGCCLCMSVDSFSSLGCKKGVYLISDNEEEFMAASVFELVSSSLLK